jgi:hypothetical protein
MTRCGEKCPYQVVDSVKQTVCGSGLPCRQVVRFEVAGRVGRKLEVPEAHHESANQGHDQRDLFVPRGNSATKKLLDANAVPVTHTL